MSQRELRAALGPDVSRRVMLQGLGLGLAGVALAPAARATTLGDGADPVWTYKGPSTSLTTGLADLGTGAVFVTERRNMRRAIVGSVTAVDIRTADVLWTRSNPDGVFLEQMFGTLATPTSVFVSSYSGHVWCFDAATGKTRWRVDGITGTDPQEPAFAVAGSTVVYPDLAGTLYARNVADGTLLWSVEVATPKTGAFVTTPLVGVGTVVVVVNDEVHAYGLAEGDLRWKKSVGTVSKRPTIAGGAVCLAEGADSTSSTAKSHLRALALKDGTQTWRVPSGGADGVFSAPTAYNGAVYYADSRGTLHAVDETTGAKLWTTSLGGNLSVGEIIADSGILYLVGDSTKQSTIYAVEIASKGQKVVSYNPPVTTARVVGVESGQCFWSRAASATAGVQVGAVNLADAFQEFFAESQLMVQDYQSTAGGDGYQGSGTTWRSHLQLLDPSGTPRADTSVRVWCEQSTTVVSDGISYSVGPDTPAWLSTDPSGELGLTVSANDPSTSDHALTCPPLYLWGNFMDPGEAMVIYPDHDTYVSLSTVQGSTLSGASDYSGSSLLPGYSSSDSEHLASTIRNTIGGTGESLGATQSAVLTAKPGKRKAKGKPPHAKSSPTSPGLGVNAGAVVSYIAFPDSTTNLVYQSTTGPTDRAYVPGPVDTWTADFATDGTVTFTADPLIDLELEPSELGSIFSDIKDFVKHVVHDGEKIEKMTWKAVKGAYQYIKTAAGNVFKLVIDTVEKAASVVAGIFATIVKDLVKVVEALSYLFDWGDIVSVHDQLSAKVSSGFDDLKDWVGGISTTPIDDWFQTVENGIEAAFDDVRNALSGTTVQSSKSGNGNPQAFYNHAGAKSYTQTRWFTDKVKQNIAKSPAAPTGSVAGAPDLGELVTGLISELGQALETDFGNLPGDLKAVFASLCDLVKDPASAGAAAFSSILGLVEDTVLDTLRFADSVIDIAIEVLADLVDAFIALLTQTIPIPVLSDLYKIVAKRELTLLDLVCLVVAIPTTIIQKAIAAAETGAAEEPTAPGAVVLDENLAYIGALAFYAVMDPFNDMFDSTGASFPALSGSVSALDAVILALSFPTDLATNTGGEYAFWGIQVIPIVLNAVALATKDNPAFEEFPYVSVPVLEFYGLFMTGLSVYLGATDAQFRGKDDLAMIQNIAMSVPYLFKFFLLAGAETQGWIPLVTIDVVCDVASLGLATAEWIVDSS
jgi:outer membrane protein assembly factor BamB